MTHVPKPKRGASCRLFSYLIALLAAAVSIFVDYPPPIHAEEDLIMKSIAVDCSAFKKDAAGNWTASRRSILTGPGGSQSGPVDSFPGLNLELLRPYGVIMIDLLNTKCGRRAGNQTPSNEPR